MATRVSARRKAAQRTMMVYNPSRGLKVSGRTTSTRRRTTKNPTRRRVTATAAVENPRRKRRRRRNPSGVASWLPKRNPSSAGGLLVAAVMAGFAVSLFDVVTARVIPQTSALVRTGVKFGGALFFQSAMGAKIPVLGRYKNDIALVLAVAGMVDLMKLYVLPVISQTVGNVTGGALNLLPASAPAPAVSDTMAGYGRTSYIY